MELPETTGSKLIFAKLIYSIMFFAKLFYSSVLVVENEIRVGENVVDTGSNHEALLSSSHGDWRCFVLCCSRWRRFALCWRPRRRRCRCAKALLQRPGAVKRIFSL